MDRMPTFSASGPTYGTANPGYIPSAAAGPAMYAPAAPPGGPMGPSAPPMSMFDPVPGYEGTVAGGGGYLPPPIPTMPMPTPDQGPTPADWQIPSISEDAAREAFISYASSNCCYNKSPARDGVITEMESFNTYRYRLETFTESRSTEWKHQVYNGQPVDAFTQPAPGPWDLPAQAPSHFHETTQSIQVPYTSSVKNCHECMGMGRIPCKECAGAGNKVCWVCNGSGSRMAGEQCSHCNGGGRENCSHCDGHGSRECTTCDGKRQLLVFINVNVKWENNREDFVAQQTSAVQGLNLSQVTGKEMFKDANYLVYPVMGFPDPAIGREAERMVREHQAKYAQTSRILQQRQTIELIPITKVKYSWKGDSHFYFVCGNELQVTDDNYPATCCCSIM